MLKSFTHITDKEYKSFFQLNCDDVRRINEQPDANNNVVVACKKLLKDEIDFKAIKADVEKLVRLLEA